MPKNKYFILTAILLLGFCMRLYRLDRPIGDWHSWRQTDTAAVSRRYLKDGINLLVPRYDDLSNIPSGLENPAGYRMVEFPLVNGLVAATYPLAQSFLNFETFHRLTSVIFSLGSIALLFFIVDFLIDTRSALFSAAVFTLLPFNIFYSSAVLPEPAFVFTSLLATYFWIRYSLKPSHPSLVWFTLAAAITLLLKPYFVFFTPALVYFYFHHQRIKGFKRWPIYLSAAIIITPFLLWRQWITQFPSGIPSSSWLFNSTNIRFRPAWFRWLFAERFGKLILGYWGLIPLGLGIILKPNQKTGWFFHWWLFGVLLYFSVLATGNVTHDYYQIITLPIISVFVAIGINFVLKKQKQFSFILASCFMLLVSIFTFAFSWFHIRDFYNINNPAIISAGQAVDQLTPANAKVIAPYGGDTAFLYQTNRTGWPIGFDIPDKIKKGATHYVSTSLDDEARMLIEHCSLVKQTNQYQLIDLTQCQFN